MMLFQMILGLTFEDLPKHEQEIIKKSLAKGEYM